MFVPKAAARPRRRQRTSSGDDAAKPPKAKRQRSVLRQRGDSTAIGLDHERKLGEQVIQLDDDVAMDNTSEMQIPIRGSKPSEARRNDSEGTIVLSSTDYYTVDQLPALPDQIRSSPSDPLKCFFAKGHNHALALTHSHAIVWPYSVASSSPSPSETFTVPIPEQCRDPTGAVPLGTLLSTATGEHPGLLVIIPSTGKIIYWETVSSAASLGLSRQKQYGIQGSTPGLLSGEYATEVLNCEPSGIIATFSSGRVAHITFRDTQGKPTVLVQFLKSNAGGGGGGIFGGIKSALIGGSWRKEVTAVQAGGSRQRGQRDVIIATSTGLIEIWDTHWNHGNALKKKYDVKDKVLAAFPQYLEKGTGEPELKVMDFAISAEQHDEPGSDESWKLFLVASSNPWMNQKQVFVVQVEFSGNQSRVLSTHAVDLSSIPTTREEAKPKILVSKAEDTAFIRINQSIAILSLTSTVKDSPTSQLLLDSHQLPLPFQDIIHLQSGKDFEILGYGAEELPDSENRASCVMMIRNFGVIRVNVIPRYPTEDALDEGQLTAKHKLEQAIFFGTMAKNPLNLAGDGGLDFPAPDIEQASLDICTELLQSESRFIPNTAISIDQHLRLRAKALGDLASLLSQKGNPLSRAARWQLLWGAEKLGAQRAMWKLEETLRAKNESAFLGQVIETMNDKFKTPLNPSNNETDPVRQWFLKDTYRMEHIVSWIKNAIKPRRGNSSKQAKRLSENILEASELLLSIMETAFRYREQHASVYGLGDDFIEDGVLADHYQDLPEFWTSKAVGYTETGNLLDWELDSCRAWIQQKSTSKDAPDSQTLNQIADNSARHLRVLGQMHQERVRWLSSQDDPKLADAAVSLEQTHLKERKWQLFKLAGIGHLRDALILAERFRDMEGLVELIIELQDQVKNQQSPETILDPTLAGESEADVNLRISQYFDKFGEQWADAYFSRQISMGHPGALLSMRKYQPAVTKFLRKNPSYAKLSWINDVTGEEDYESAAVCLQNLALNEEKQLWCHRVEVSLAKLGKLASAEKGGPLVQEDIKRLDDYSEVDKIQTSVYQAVKQGVEGAIDLKAEAELALESLGPHLVQDRPSLHQILGDALSSLVNKKVVGPDSLIDILTLIGPTEKSEEGVEFHEALQVLLHGGYSQDPLYVSALRKLIWRRCMIKDDWEEIGKEAELNDNSEDATHHTALYQTLLFCIKREPIEHLSSSINLTFFAERKGPSFQPLYTPLCPGDALMADSEAEILISRFHPEQKSRVASDLKQENRILLHYVDAGKLDFWFQHLLTSIEDAATVEA
ncbi:hypothetical protein N7495_000663 [Penicillium taxi]|uniref:uncharacterized protein n=1 Tax=Penicillium taxi TaxID=168475 RepID=UPI002544EAE4|nr:uncharacterized protein N7495_000663 [Penicillium taxi]KAJ5907981.1 hypothetical protein N7495_000663 [Penicillium taxi]